MLPSATMCTRNVVDLSRVTLVLTRRAKSCSMCGALSIFHPSGTSTDTCSRSGFKVGCARTCRSYQPSWSATLPANLAVVVFFVWAGMHFEIGGRLFRIALAAFCAGLLYLLTQTLFRVPVETYENSAYRRVSRGQIGRAHV